MKQRLEPVAAAPITDDGDLINYREIAAIVLRNAGTATVKLFDGRYTLDPKETISFNATQNDSLIYCENIPVRFDTSTGSVKRLEILFLTVQNC